MQLVFAGAIPNKMGNITIYTDDGTEATTITGFDTLYRDEGQTVYLSNDGSVHTAPETPEGPGDPPSHMFRHWKSYRQRNAGRYPQPASRLSIRA